MKRIMAALLCLLLVLATFSAQAEDVSFYYQYLRDSLIPKAGQASSDLLAAKAGKLGATLAASCSGVISAAVMDFDGDGQLELFTVEGGQSTKPYSDYAWRLGLYGEEGLLDTKDNVVWVESGACGGSMKVDIQRSEGKVYIICDVSIQNMDSSEWDYHSRRFYAVENRGLADLTEYESLLHSNSGISLQNEAGWTTLCSAELTWDSVQVLDFSSLSASVSDPALAQIYIPREVNLASAVPEYQDTEATLLMKKIENVTPLLHVSTDTLENGDFAFIYNAENGCRVDIISDPAGAVREVRILDSGLYDKKWALKHIDGYLDMDMTEELKSIFRVVAGEPPVLIGSEKSNQDRIVFRNQGEIPAGSAWVIVEKAVYTAAAGSVTSSVVLTWPDAAEQDSEAHPAGEAAPEQSAEQPLNQVSEQPAEQASDPSAEQGSDVSEAPDSDLFQSYTAKTTKKGVNVRQEPDQRSKKIAQLGKGEEVTVTGAVQDAQGTTWYQVVTRKGKEGYIRGDLLKRAD